MIKPEYFLCLVCVLLLFFSCAPLNPGNDPLVYGDVDADVVDAYDQVILDLGDIVYSIQDFGPVDEPGYSGACTGTKGDYAIDLTFDNYDAGSGRTIVSGTYRFDRTEDIPNTAENHDTGPLVLSGYDAQTFEMDFSMTWHYTGVTPLVTDHVTKSGTVRIDGTLYLYDDIMNWTP